MIDPTAAATPHASPGAPRHAIRRRVVLGIVILLSVGTTLGIVLPYLGFQPDDSPIGIREDVPLHYPLLIVHILCGGVALLLGPLQFVRLIRNRYPRMHRWTGRVYLLVGVLPSGVAGFAVAPLTTAGPVAAAAFAWIAVFWLATAACGYLAVRRGDFAAHERWMRRNFATTFTAVTLRAWLGLLIGAQIPLLDPVYGGSFEALFLVAYSASAWLGWVLNIAVTEWWLRTSAR